jgi:endoglycosylceramidase
VKRVLACLAVALSTVLLAVALPPTETAGAATLRGHGTWVTDAQGRVVILHGLNQVYKVAPYTPAHDGFGANDAKFLQANGFNVVRVGVIWAAVEPRPGQYNARYLKSIGRTVRTLAAHGIYSLLDFHQDLYNEKFQGEGAPAWAVQDATLPNPALGFPGNYFANPAENHAWDAFWANAPAADGVGLQTHYARAWARVAGRFHSNKHVLGYELLNEPWPGTAWHPCITPTVGCPQFDQTLTAFYQRVSAAIRHKDRTHTVWIEPNVVSAEADANNVGLVRDPHLGFAFHDYCGTESELQTNLLCPQLDDQTVSAELKYGTAHRVPTLLTEFGATQDKANLTEMVGMADKYMLGWTEWAYTGNDKTSTSPDGQALVLDPAKPPRGSNVETAKLKALAEVYPKVIAGTPTGYSFSGGVFHLTYSTARVSGHGRFGVGSVTVIAVPHIQYPHGYRVTVSGARVVSAAGAPTLRLRSRHGAHTIKVTVRAR